ncbi:MAG: hypothetical protein IJF16_03700 [Clostridia bacterium]|nr:hypothetical protein [Clostridia bacterium]
MPLPMVHLAVAYELRDEAFAGADKAAYFLGANAPDSIHKREGWVSRDKQVSHLTLDLPKEDKHALLQERILALWAQREGEALADSFRAGYVVHLLTDMVWNKYLYHPIFKAAFEADAAPVQDINAAYYNDTDLIDLYLYQNEPWRAEVFGLLAQKSGYDFEDKVSSGEVELWRDHVLNFYDRMDLSKYKPVRYIQPEDIYSFIKQAADMTREIMR